jgi:glucose-6-phosphate isomerase
MINIDIENLLKGAQQATDLCLKSDNTNPAALSAAWQYALCKEGYHVSNLFVFSNELLGLCKWWKQLLAESLGKEKKRDGIPNKDTILPITSLGSTDMHSIGQLFLANIIPIATTFVVFETKEQSPIIHHYEEQFNNLVANIQGRSLAAISKSILQGIKKTYKIKELPYRTITIPEKNAYCIGQFLQQAMFEIVYLGYLLDVYPFDQPAVELYKQETRKILAHE